MDPTGNIDQKMVDDENSVSLASLEDLEDFAETVKESSTEVNEPNVEANQTVDMIDVEEKVIEEKPVEEVNAPKYHEVIFSCHAKNFVNNPSAIGIDPSSLRDGSFQCVHGLDAVNFHKQQFPSSQANFPEGFMESDRDLLYFNFVVYFRQDPKNPAITQYVSVICFNEEELARHVMEGNPSVTYPYHKFLAASMRKSTWAVSGQSMSFTRSADTHKAAVDLIIDKVCLPNDYTNDPEIPDPDFLKDTTKLFKYQKCSVKDMLTKENALQIVPYSPYSTINYGKVIYTPFLYRFDLTHTLDFVTIRGGAVADEVGRGKSLQMIVLSILNPAPADFPPIIDSEVFSLKGQVVQKDIVKMPYSKATLMIVPSSLPAQWVEQMTQHLKNVRQYKVLKITTLKDFNSKKNGGRLTQADFLDADFVIVSFDYLKNDNFTSLWKEKSGEFSKFATDVWDEQSHYNATMYFNQCRSNVVADLEKFRKIAEKVGFHLIHWRRVIVDEYHEAMTGANIHVQNILRHIRSDYRWAMSATLFSNKMAGVIKTLEFVTGYSSIKYGDNILNDDSIVKYASTQMVRRNTKEMIEMVENYKLPPIEESNILLNFSSTERMIYNAKLADPRNDPSNGKGGKYSEYFRQLCCHPQLSDEAKYTLMNCKNLDEIETLMGNVYKEEVNVAKANVLKIKKRYFIVKLKCIIECLALIQKIQKDVKHGRPYIFAEIAQVFHDIGEKCTPKKLYLDIKGKFITQIDKKDGKKGEKEDVFIPITEDIINLYFEVYDVILLKLMTFVFRTGGMSDPKIADLSRSLAQHKEKLKEETSIMEGKIITETFFKNVSEKLRKTQQNKNVKEIEFDMDDLDNLDDFENFEEDESEKCNICLGNIKPNDVGVTKCGHIFCYSCLLQSLAHRTTCPLCGVIVKNHEVFTMTYDMAKDKYSDQERMLINTLGTKMANLIFFLKSKEGRCIVFSQWDDLLAKVGKILEDNGIKNVFCKGTCQTKEKAIRDFKHSEDIRVIMLSSVNSASGTNLTEAEYVIFLDPLYGNYEERSSFEWQGIGRLYRTGQQKSVKVVRLLIRDTVEEEIHKDSVAEDIRRPDYDFSRKREDIYA